MKMTNLYFVAVFASLCGCATPVKVVDYYDLPSSALGSLRGMTILPDDVLSDSEYSDLGIATGFSCSRVRIGTGSFDDEKFNHMAVEQLKLNAAAMGAHHITTPQCVVSEKLDMTNNCWASLTCTGHGLVLATVP